jgi:uncharacterized protein involved in exopolysaccharide biosynthesis
MAPEPIVDRATDEGDGLAGPFVGQDSWERDVGEADLQPPTSLFWFVVGALRRHRWMIVSLTALGAVASVVVALVLPVQYGAVARVLLPTSGSGGLSALIGDLSPVGGALLGGGAKDYNRYLAILTSRSLQDAVVNRFDLIERYETANKRDPMGYARAELADRTTFEVDLEYDFLSISVLDEDRQTSADMVNFYVSELNRRNQELSAQNASGQRRYVETRYAEAELALDSVRAEMQRFQEANGVVEVPAMAEALMTSLADARAEVVRAEVEYEALRAQFGDDNPQVQAARDVVDAARRAQGELIAGQDASMPVALRRLPALGAEYSRLYQELLTQTKIIEATRPILEQARFAEEQERIAVQVLDRAVPPVLKARPQRMLLVAVVTLSAFLLAMIMAVILAWLKQNRVRLAELLRHS